MARSLSVKDAENTRDRSAPTAKQHLAAIRHLFDWLVVG